MRPGRGLKYVFALLAVVLGRLIGGYFAEKSAKKAALLAELCAACDKLRVGIGFSYTALSALCKEIAAGASPALGTILGAFVASLESGVACGEAVGSACAACGLGRPETDALVSLLSLLGRSDRDEQLGLLATYRATLDGFRNDAKEESARCGALYKKLGLLGGIAVGILLL